MISLTHSLTLPLTHSLTLYFLLTHWLTIPLTLSLTINNHLLAYSLTHSLTHSLTLSLTYSLTHPRTIQQFVLKHWWALLTRSLTWCIMLWRCDIYWCCVRLLGLIVSASRYYTTCTHIHAPPSGSSRPCRSDFKYGLYTPRTPCMRRRPWTWHASEYM
jgi:hypothetical protein